jgi:hypothetical protein
MIGDGLVGETRFAGNRMTFVKKTLIGLAIAMPLSCFLAVPFFKTWAEKRFLIFYLAPILSMAAVWMHIKIDEKYASRVGRTIDGLVFLGALGRFVIGGMLPFSGHMLFFTHTMLTTDSKVYRLFAGLLILETTYIKLRIWEDYKSWGLGTCLGILSGVAYSIVGRKKGIPGERR